MELWSDGLVTPCISLLQVEALERVKISKSDEDPSVEKSLVQEELSKIVLNPNVFTDFKVAGSPEVGTKPTPFRLSLFFYTTWIDIHAVPESELCRFQAVASFLADAFFFFFLFMYGRTLRPMKSSSEKQALISKRPYYQG